MTDEDRSGAGRPKVFGFGYRFLLRICRLRRRESLRRAMRKGINLGDPVEAIAFALSKRKQPRLADEVLRALGYPTRYTGRRARGTDPVL